MTYDRYCAALLALLKPWRDLRSDLKNENETWSEAYQSFLETAPEHNHRVISGIQYFHECDTAAKEGDRTHVNHFTEDSTEDNDIAVQEAERHWPKRQRGASIATWIAGG